jgi:hypothetical protein
MAAKLIKGVQRNPQNDGRIGRNGHSGNMRRESSGFYPRNPATIKLTHYLAKQQLDGV